MIYSMTGYGKGNLTVNGRDITVEIKSVNHRYIEYVSKIPKSYIFLDDRIKKYVNSKISRGKVEVSLAVRAVSPETVGIEVNIPLARSYQKALLEISKELGLDPPRDVYSVARYEGVITRAGDEGSRETLWQDVLPVLDMAMNSFLSMRLAEGEKLCADVLSKLDNVEKMVLDIEELAPLRVGAYRDKLYSRLKILLDDRQIDDRRILTEAALFADRRAVDEETARLHSHISQYRQILQEGSPRGKKLDFLTQEMNREVNTIGSKANDLEITRIVIDLKSEIEKIREQIQNIE